MFNMIYILLSYSYSEILCSRDEIYIYSGFCSSQDKINIPTLRSCSSKMRYIFLLWVLEFSRWYIYFYSGFLSSQYDIFIPTLGSWVLKMIYLFLLWVLVVLKMRYIFLLWVLEFSRWYMYSYSGFLSTQDDIFIPTQGSWVLKMIYLFLLWVLELARWFIYSTLGSCSSLDKI